ncbi:MAG: NADH-quinone oxidoreductase subunit L [Pseudomonadota bacterium]
MIPYIAVFAPLVAFVLAGLFGRYLRPAGCQIVTCVGVIGAAIATLFLFVDVVHGQSPMILHVMDWITVGTFKVQWALRLDQLAVVMMCVVNIVSACVHVYSVGYMQDDPHKGRFMAYLSLFTFAMLMLVTSDNLLQLFFGWEGVGVASYLLIGFYNYKDSANAAAIKAFIINRVGDLGLALGIFATFVLFDSINFADIFAQAPAKADEMISIWGYQLHGLTVIGLLLFIGAVGKSAQLGLHTWLPDAMEGPTPVSALIHAATMVTAGVFLIARFSPLYEYAPDALQVVCVLGALTAFVAATIGLTQFDIKRVIAYSTMSQLGYMFFALGVSAYSAAIFHLMTHAFFKALLFLGAGSVIHAMHHEQDMRNMGGLWKKIPITYALMWIGSLALAGIPFFAGYYSKDMILETVYADHTGFGLFAFWMGIAAAVMTAFYSWRLILMTFHGKPRGDHHTHDHAHESPWIMLAPLFVLAAGALLAGTYFYHDFVGDVAQRAVFWGHSLFVLPENDTVTAAHHVPSWVKLLPIFVAIMGIIVAYVYYIWQKDLPEKTVRAFRPLHRLFYNKWYFDELYDALFVKTAQRIGQAFWLYGDRDLIDGYGPNGVASVSKRIGTWLSAFQSGFVSQYAFVMVAGVITLLLWLAFRGSLLGMG